MNISLLKRNPSWSLGTAACGAILGILSSSLVAQDAPDDTAGLSQRIEVDSTPPDRQGALGGFADIVETVSPSVVSISTSKSMQMPPQIQNFYGDPRLRRFFGLPDPGPRGSQDLPKQQGLGSGVILTSDGYIVTNHHVVTGADEILVTLQENKKPYPAKIVGEDPQSDLAVLKIEADGLPTIKAADSSVLKAGDTVLAIGNPFGLSQTVTAGIISALGRTAVGILDADDYENFIQTDASINPGNSGGALVDNKGRLIGINTAILSRTGANIGIGFAIPINMVVNIADQLIATGEIQRGFLGVLLGDLTPDLAEAMDVPGDQGVLVNEVVPDTPAANAGLQDGDVILQVGDQTATDMRKTRLMVSSTRPGTQLPLRVLRDGKEIDLEVEIGRLPSEGVAQASGGDAPSRQPGGPANLVSGLTVENLNPAYRQQLNLDSDLQGVVVTQVDPQSEAASKGLQRGDVITEVGRQPVENVDAAVEAAKNASGNLLLVRVLRDGASRFVALKTEKS